MEFSNDFGSTETLLRAGRQWLFQQISGKALLNAARPQSKHQATADGAKRSAQAWIGFGARRIVDDAPSDLRRQRVPRRATLDSAWCHHFIGATVA